VIDWDTRARVDQDRAEETGAHLSSRVLNRLHALRDEREHGWADLAQRTLLLAGSLCLALVVGALATIVVVGPQTLLRSGSPRGAGGTTATATNVAAAPEFVQPPHFEESTFEPARTLPFVGVLAATAVPTLAPTRMPTVAPTTVRTTVPTPRPTPLPTADVVWPATLIALDPIWSTDLPRTLALLDDFRARFPNYQPAVDKQYAALVAYGERLAAEGDLGGATSQLTRARDLDPERVEAPAALRALARASSESATAASDGPTASDAVAEPTEPAPEPDVDPPPPTLQRRPAAVPPVPAAVAPVERSPASSPPTPTKVPFRPSNGV
jgi:hypothetical protein